MLHHETGSRLFQAAVAQAVIWLVCFVEFAICDTAWGGLFTVVLSFVLKSVLGILVVVIAWAMGFLLRLPQVRSWWLAIGHRSLLLSAVALAIMVFASLLGLRTVDPVSGYRMMPFWAWFLCLVGIAFPIVNLPKRHERIV